MPSLSPTLPDWLAYRATTSPARLALAVASRTLSFAELDAECTRMARRLATLGVREGDRVATLLHNGLPAAVLPHAVLRLGATLLPLNVRLSEAEIGWQVAHATPSVLVAEEATAQLARSAIRARSDLTVASADSAGAAAIGCSPLSAVSEADLALRLVHDADHVLSIMYTSGTSGRPKAAMLTVGNYWWSAAGSALNLGVHDDDRWLACLPLFHVGGLSILLRSAIYGTTAVVHERFDAGGVNHALDHEGMTIVSVVAVMLQRMLDARADRPYPASLRCVLVGGGPVPRPLLERCARSGIPVVQTYGLTECASQVATLSPASAALHPDAAGHPLYPNIVRILRDDGGAAGAGEAGEILVRGPVVMSGYFNDPVATAGALADGWLRTGDVGRVDPEGYLYVLDRRDDLIVTGGENVYPAEVESVLLAHPWVAEAAVFGVADETWGQRVVAAVRLRDDVTADRAADVLRAHCRERLAGYKTPSDMRIVSKPLPRTESGKLRRSVLREISTGLFGADDH